MNATHEEVTLNIELIEKRMAELGVKDTMELARTAEVPYGTLRRAMNGERKPSALLLLKLVNALDVDFKNLVIVTATELTRKAA